MVRGSIPLTLALVASSSVLMAVEPAAPSRPTIRQALVAQPTTVASITLLPAPKKCFNADQISGMREAVQILETVNHSDAATELRHRITELELEQVKQLLEQKVLELTSLQTELANLRGPDGSKQISFSFQVLEVSLTKLRDLGLKSDELFRFLDKQEPGKNNIIDDSEKAIQFLEKLKKNNVAKLIAEPTIVTTSDRPAHFHSGDEIAVPIPQGASNVSIEMKKIGTKIDAVPVLQKDGSLKLDFRMSISEIDPALSRQLDGQLIPGFRTRQVGTGATLRSGQTLVLNGMKQQRVEATLIDGRLEEHVNEIALLVLVRPTYSAAAE